MNINTGIYYFNITYMKRFYQKNLKPSEEAYLYIIENKGSVLITKSINLYVLYPSIIGFLNQYFHKDIKQSNNNI